MSVDLSLFTDERLCEIIIASRHLGSMREEAIECMKELAKRRAEGSLFDFETHINEKIKILPDIKNINMKEKMNLGINLSFLKNLKLIK